MILSTSLPGQAFAAAFPSPTERLNLYTVKTPPSTWTDQELVNPHLVQDKAEKVRAMFSAIAPSYDLNNRVHSAGRDQAWRKTAVRLAGVRPGDIVLDVACGTGDLTLAFTKTPAGSVLGLDFTYEMLTLAREKSRGRTRNTTPPMYLAGDATQLPLADASADVVSIAFGIRNVTKPAAAMREFSRVLRPGGRLVILEFSTPDNRLIRGAYNFYFQHIMPRTASWIARDQSGAYRYLPQSVQTFIQRDQMLQLIHDAGMINPTHRTLTFGVAVLYRGEKPSSVTSEERASSRY
jgi:demethylmenaquinone methyltransferase/2-methoxy-6-polyprenyl-1,4-benzoquinol methylase